MSSMGLLGVKEPANRESVMYLGARIRRLEREVCESSKTPGAAPIILTHADRMARIETLWQDMRSRAASGPLSVEDQRLVKVLLDLGLIEVCGGEQHELRVALASEAT
jgi:hypothetical protein